MAPRLLSFKLPPRRLPETKSLQDYLHARARIDKAVPPFGHSRTLVINVTASDATPFNSRALSAIKIIRTPAVFDDFLHFPGTSDPAPA